jgi:hypothetical protein
MYTVNVGNVGNVWNGSNPVRAQAEYAEWIRQAKGNGNVSRAHGETVTMLKDGEPVRTFDPNAGFYYVEFTDTYGGDANYCWVRRYKVKARTKIGAIRKAAREMGYSGRMYIDGDFGDMARYNVRNAAVCAFVSWYDAESHGQESHETI